MVSQQTQDSIIASLWRRHDVVTSFWRHNDVIIASCARWVCTSPVSSLYTEANEAPLEERRLKLSMHYYVKTRACIDNPAHHALHEFDRTTRDLYAPRPNGRGGMTRTPAPPIGLKVDEAMTSAEINAELVCPLRTPNFPPGAHDYYPKRHDLIEGVSKCMISGQEVQAKFNEFREAQGSHDEVYTDGSKMNERVGAAAVINRHFQNGETTCRQLSKRLPDNNTIFAAEATAISLALNYYQHMGPARKWTREWGQRRSSNAISRMVIQTAANCPKDCQTTAPYLQLRLQPSVWHWTITNTRAQSIMMW